ncbi:MAG: thioredoxin family protein [Bacteroidia bacterium]
MKRIQYSISTLIMMLALTMGSAQAEGIEFFHGTWDEVVAEAKKSRRLIFVDAYTTWCGPCKMMARNTFTDAEVGEFHNDNFVNYKFDMEKGEGPTFAAKYGVRAYPTIFYIDFTGAEIHKAVGYRAPNQLLAEGKKALNSDKNEATKELSFKDGALKGQELYKYAAKLKADDKPFEKAASEYFATLSTKELQTKAGWEAIQELGSDVYSREVQLLIKKRKKFKKKYGAGVDAKIDEIFRSTALKMAYQKDQKAFDKLVEESGKLKDKGRMANRMKLSYAEANGDWEGYAEAAVNFYSEYPTTNKDDLKRLLENFVDKVDGPGLLASAGDWGRQLTALENTYNNNALYARLLQKAGKMREAYTVANKAISIAQDSEEDYEEMQELADSLRSKL